MTALINPTEGCQGPPMPWPTPTQPCGEVMSVADGLPGLAHDDVVRAIAEVESVGLARVTARGPDGTPMVMQPTIPGVRLLEADLDSFLVEHVGVEDASADLLMRFRMLKRVQCLLCGEPHLVDVFLPSVLRTMWSRRAVVRIAARADVYATDDTGVLRPVVSPEGRAARVLHIADLVDGGCALFDQDGRSVSFEPATFAPSTGYGRARRGRRRRL